MYHETAALILLAGQSRRMGAFKPLLPLSGKTVAVLTAASALGVCERAVVVTGKNASQVEEALSSFGDRLSFVRNERYASTDMLASVKTGLAALPLCRQFFLLPGDMPLVREETFEKLYSESLEAEAVFPVYHGRRGHPALLCADLIPAILSYEGEDGLRGFLRTVKNQKEVETDDEGVLLDLDTEEDYARAVSMIR